MSDMFEYLEAQAAEENLPFKNAAVVAIDRSERRFGSFVSSAQGDKEFQSRLALVMSEIEKIAVETCEEYGYDDPQHIAKLVLGQIQLLAERGSNSADTDSIGKAKRQDMPTQDPAGYYTDPSPKLNPGSAGDNMKNTNPAISELKPFDQQHPSDLSYPNDGPLPKANLVNADKPMQPEFNVADSTMTFPDKGQADPVTSKTAYYMDDTWTSDESVDDFIDRKQQERGRGLQGMTDYAVAPDAFSEEEDLQDQLEPEEDPTAKNYSLEDRDINGSKFEERNWKNYRDQQHKPAMAKAAAERMDFNSLSEIMTPSDAVGHLVEAGMPQHEAKDRIDFYVNHVNPGWASKNWTSTVEKESLWDTNDPALVEMSHNVGSPSVEDIRGSYEQYAGSGQFETSQELINALFSMYAENATSVDQIDGIAQAFNEAIGRAPSNVEEVKQHAMRFANTKVADHPGVIDDQIQMIRGVLERGVGRGGNLLTDEETEGLKAQLHDLLQQVGEAKRDYYTPGMNIDPAEEDALRAAPLDDVEEVPASMDLDMDSVREDYEGVPSRTSPTKNLNVNYKMVSSVYNSFLKKQNKK